MQRGIQVFCKSQTKVDLLAHAFEQWCEDCQDGVLKDVVNTRQQQAMEEENIVHALSQEVSQEPWQTPGKMPNPSSQEEQSPVPFPLNTHHHRRHFAFAPLWCHRL